MADPVNCPNCGSTLPPGAIACARCGHQLATPASAPQPPAPSASAAPPPPPPADTSRAPATGEPSRGPSFKAPGAPAQLQMPVNLDLNEMLGRWGVERSLYVFAALGAAVLGILIASLGHTLYLVADDFLAQSDGVAWQQLGLGLSVIAVALFALVRWQSPRDARPGQDDRRIALAIGGMAALWMLVGFALGVGKRLDPEGSWWYYSLTFSFVLLAWNIISRPVPARVSTYSTVNIGVGALCVAAGLLVIGTFLAMSDTESSYSMGVTFQDTGIVIAVLAFATFAGLPRGR